MELQDFTFAPQRSSLFCFVPTALFMALVHYILATCKSVLFLQGFVAKRLSGVSVETLNFKQCWKCYDSGDLWTWTECILHSEMAMNSILGSRVEC